MVSSPVSRLETPTAAIAGTRIVMLPTISTTMISTAIGAFATAPNSDIIPTITKTGTVSIGTYDGLSRCRPMPSAPPIPAPMVSPGAKTPPLPPEPSVREVARILKNGSKMRTTRGTIE